ncbi:hypothetical protein BDD12DRAFT_808370 [Trichophaea hybrida]|nr:hypothetical protein BDD12DRAFT_808370 [Trichophaea hybrida]
MATTSLKSGTAVVVPVLVAAAHLRSQTFRVCPGPHGFNVLAKQEMAENCQVCVMVDEEIRNIMLPDLDWVNSGFNMVFEESRAEATIVIGVECQYGGQGKNCLQKPSRFHYAPMKEVLVYESKRSTQYLVHGHARTDSVYFLVPRLPRLGKFKFARPRQYMLRHDANLLRS